MPISTFKYYLNFVSSKPVKKFKKEFDTAFIPDKNLNYVNLYNLLSKHYISNERRIEILKNCYNEFYTTKLLGYNYK